MKRNKNKSFSFWYFVVIGVIFVAIIVALVLVFNVVFHVVITKDSPPEVSYVEYYDSIERSKIKTTYYNGYFVSTKNIQ